MDKTFLTFFISFCAYNFIKAEIIRKPVIHTQNDPSVGFKLKLECRFEVGINDSYTVTWYANNKSLPDGTSGYDFRDRTLEFTVKKSHKNNKFECMVTVESSSEKSDSVLLQPKYPAIATIPKTYTCNKSESVEIRCEADGFPADFTFGDWYHFVNKTQIKILRGRSEGNASILKINSCSYQVAGQYQCNVNNGIKYPNLTSLSLAETHLKVNDFPVVSGQSVINFTNGFDIMLSYYSYPQVISRHLYLDDIELRRDESDTSMSVPLLFFHSVVHVSGTVVIITVQNQGIYRYTLQNDFGSTNVTVDVWSTKTRQEIGASKNKDMTDCTFSSLSFEVQVVIIVAAGLVTCTLILSGAMIIVKRCMRSDNNEESYTQNQPRTEKTDRYQIPVNIRNVKSTSPRGVSSNSAMYEEISTQKDKSANNQGVTKRKKTLLPRKHKTFKQKLFGTRGKRKTLLDNHKSIADPNNYSVPENPRAQSSSMTYDDAESLPKLPKRNSGVKFQISGGKETVPYIQMDIKESSDGEPTEYANTKIE